MAKVYLVGAGPGAADLLTLRAARLIQAADIVFHDALVDDEVLALIAGRKVSVGKRCGAHSTAQQFIHRRLIRAARHDTLVVRLKGGDPMLFGRAQEEIEALTQAGIDVEVVPGVTAAQAAAADLRVSLTRRAVSRSVVFATPRVGAEENPSEWLEGVARADTAVIYMAGHEAPEVARALLAAGKPPHWPVAIVTSAGTARVEALHTTLCRLAASVAWQPKSGPTLLCMGDVFAALEAVHAAPVNVVRQA